MFIKSHFFRITFFLNLILIILIIISLTKCKESEEENLIDLTNYTYPSMNSSEEIIRVAILGTNDLHGEIFANRYPDSLGNRFSGGGATYIYSYAQILREEWGDHFLWLDGGDQFQGTMECMLSDCGIMKDFSNFAGINATTIGNHEFDYGIDILKNHINQQNFHSLCANIYDKKNNKFLYEEEMWENIKPYEIFKIGNNPEIKIGVIGLATKETPSSCDTDLSDYEFVDYFEITKNFTELLKNEKKVDAVILLTHFGPKCLVDGEEDLELKIRTKEDFQNKCEDNYEIMNFLQKLKNEGVAVDAVVGAHVHNVVHQWVSDIPVIKSSGSSFFNILYLPFKLKENGEGVTLVNSLIEIEGPVPVCDKLWPNTLKCDFRLEDSGVMKNFIFHNKTLKIDQKLMDYLKYWDDIIQEKLNYVLVSSSIIMELDKQNETVLTNFVCDVGRIVTQADICFYNLGGIRTTWYIGDINEIDIFKMFPFNNTWMTFEMTGNEVTRMFKELNYKTIYPASGLYETFRVINGNNDLVDISLWDGVNEKKLEGDKVYTICTNDYLANGGSRMGVIREWYKELKNPKEHGIIRDSFIKYAGEIKVINDYFYFDKNHPRLVFID